MINKLSKNIVNYLVLEGNVTVPQRKIYEYGVRQLIMYFCDFVGIVLIGIYEEMLIYTFLISILFIVLQRYAGSYHAPRRWMCYVVSMFLIIFSVKSFQFLQCENIRIGSLFGVSFVIVFLAPVENNKKKLDEKEKRTYKIKCLYICFVYIFGGVLLKLLSISNIYQMLLIVFVDIMALQICGVIALAIKD